MSASLHAALAYAARGFSVIPTFGKVPHYTALHDVCGSAGWGRFQESRPTTDEIHAWYDVAPEAGVAIITGTASRLVVADIEHDRLDHPVAAQILATRTATATTPGGGRHVYFDAPPHAMGTRRVDWGDVKAEGGYVIAPPDGLRREWLVSLTEAPLASAELLEGLVTRITPRGISPLEVSAGSEPEGEGEALLERLADWDARRDFVEAVAKLLAIPANPGEKFPCILPGHEPDRRPSANLFRCPDSGHVLYRCWQTRTTRTLTQTFAARTARTPWEALLWTSSIHAIWKLRLLVVTRLLTVPTPTRLHVPADFPARFRKHIPAVEELFDARSLSKLGLATTLVPEFLGPWIGRSTETAKELRHALRSANAIHRTCKKSGNADLYLPGRALRRQEVA